MECGVAERGFRGFRAAVIEMNVVFPRETHAPVNLNATVADRASRIAGVHFGDGDGGGRVGRVFFERPAGVIDSGTRTLGLEIHVRALVLDGLEHSDGFAELFSRLRVFDGDVERALHAANEFGGERGGGDIQRTREAGIRGDLFRWSVAKLDDVEFARQIHAL